MSEYTVDVRAKVTHEQHRILSLLQDAMAEVTERREVERLSQLLRNAA